MNKKQLYESIMRFISKEVNKALNESYADELRKYNKDKIYWDSCKHTASARNIWNSMSYEKFRNAGNEDIDYQTYLEIMNNIKNRIAFYDKHPEPSIPPEKPEKWDGDFLCGHYYII